MNVGVIEFVAESILYDGGWQTWAPFPTTFANQSEDTQREFETRVKQTIVEFAEQGTTTSHCSFGGKPAYH